MGSADAAVEAELLEVAVEAARAAAAELLDHTRLDVKWFLRELFQSRYLYSPECYRTRIASPAE